MNKKTTKRTNKVTKKDNNDILNQISRVLSEKCEGGVVVVSKKDGKPTSLQFRGHKFNGHDTIQMCAGLLEEVGEAPKVLAALTILMLGGSKK